MQTIAIQFIDGGRPPRQTQVASYVQIPSETPNSTQRSGYIVKVLSAAVEFPITVAGRVERLVVVSHPRFQLITIAHHPFNNINASTKAIVVGDQRSGLCTRNAVAYNSRRIQSHHRPPALCVDSVVRKIKAMRVQNQIECRNLAPVAATDIVFLAAVSLETILKVEL